MWKRKRKRLKNNRFHITGSNIIKGHNEHEEIDAGQLLGIGYGTGLIGIKQ